MKRYIFALLLCTISCLQASIKRLVIKVNQMTCTLCIQGIIKKVSALPFVERVEDVDLKKASATITLKQPNQETGDTVIPPLQKAIKNAGFQFAGIVKIEE